MFTCIQKLPIWTGSFRPPQGCPNVSSAPHSRRACHSPQQKHTTETSRSTFAPWKCLWSGCRWEIRLFPEFRILRLRVGRQQVVMQWQGRRESSWKSTTKLSKTVRSKNKLNKTCFKQFSKLTYGTVSVFVLTQEKVCQRTMVQTLKWKGLCENKGICLAPE